MAEAFATPQKPAPANVPVISLLRPEEPMGSLVLEYRNPGSLGLKMLYPAVPPHLTHLPSLMGQIS